jgi:hypothetical protein
MLKDLFPNIFIAMYYSFFPPPNFCFCIQPDDGYTQAKHVADCCL